jgi:hypothetical protein
VGVQYAGITVNSDDRDGTWAAWVEANISTLDLFEWWKKVLPGSVRLDFLGRPGVIDNLPRIKIGVLHWPRSASRWAVAHFIVSTTRLNQINAAVGTGTPAAQTLSITWTDGKTGNQTASISPKLYMLPARPLSAIDPSTPGLTRAWLLTLVDERFWWWQKSTGALTVTENTTTWAQLYTSLGSALGVTITADAVNANYMKPSGILAAPYEPVPAILDAVAFSCGQRIVRKLDGTVLARNAVNAASDQGADLALSTSRSKSAGGRILLSSTDHVAQINSQVPGTVECVFPRSDSGVVGSSFYVKDVTLASLALTDFASTAVGTGFTETFRCPALANYTGGGTPANQTEMDNLAKQAATDYYRWAKAQYDIVYDGIVPWVPTGLDDFIEWTHKEGGDASTRIQKGPEPKYDLLHASSQGSAWFLTYSPVWISTLNVGTISVSRLRQKRKADTISASTDNYASAAGYGWLDFTTSGGSWNLTGITSGNDGDLLEITNNRAGSGTLTIKHDASSTAANRFYTSDGTDLVLQLGESALVKYNSTASRWIVLFHCCGVTQINTGTGLTGGPITNTGTVSIANTAVTAGSYTNANITVNAQGQLTSASNGSGSSGALVGGKIKTSGGQSISSDGLSHVVQLRTVVKDTSTYTSVQDLITARDAGWFHIASYLEYTVTPALGGTTVNNYALLQINGVTVCQCPIIIPTTVSNSVSMSHTISDIMVQLAINDTVQLLVVNNAGASLTIATNTRLAVQKVDLCG